MNFSILVNPRMQAIVQSGKISSKEDLSYVISCLKTYVPTSIQDAFATEEMMLGLVDSPTLNVGKFDVLLARFESALKKTQDAKEEVRDYYISIFHQFVYCLDATHQLKLDNLKIEDKVGELILDQHDLYATRTTQLITTAAKCVQDALKAVIETTATGLKASVVGVDTAGKVVVALTDEFGHDILIATHDDVSNVATMVGGSPFDLTVSATPTAEGISQNVTLHHDAMNSQFADIIAANDARTQQLIAQNRGKVTENTERYIKEAEDKYISFINNWNENLQSIVVDSPIFDESRISKNRQIMSEKSDKVLVEMIDIAKKKFEQRKILEEFNKAIVAIFKKLGKHFDTIQQSMLISDMIETYYNNEEIKKSLSFKDKMKMKTLINRFFYGNTFLGNIKNVLIMEIDRL